MDSAFSSSRPRRLDTSSDRSTANHFLPPSTAARPPHSEGPGTNSHQIPSLHRTLSVLPSTTPDRLLDPSLPSTLARPVRPPQDSLSARTQDLRTSSVVEESISFGTVEDKMSVEDVVPNSEDEGEPLGPTRQTDALAGANGDSSIRDFSVGNSSRSKSSSLRPPAATEEISSFTSGSHPVVAAAASTSRASSTNSMTDANGRLKPRRISKEARMAAQARLDASRSSDQVRPGPTGAEATEVVGVPEGGSGGARARRKRGVVADSDDEDEMAIVVPARPSLVNEKAKSQEKGSTSRRKPSAAYKSAATIESSQQKDAAAPAAPAATERDEEEEDSVVVVQARRPAKKKARSAPEPPSPADAVTTRAKRTSTVAAAVKSVAKGKGKAKDKEQDEARAVTGLPFSLTEPRGSRSRTKGLESSSVAGSPKVPSSVSRRSGTASKGKKRKAVVESEEEAEEEAEEDQAGDGKGGEGEEDPKARKKVVEGNGKPTVVVPRVVVRPPTKKGDHADEVVAEEPASANDASNVPGKENKDPSPSPSSAKAVSAPVAGPSKPNAGPAKAPAPEVKKRGLASVLAKFGQQGIRRVGLVRERKHHLHTTIDPSPRVQKRVKQKLTKKRGEYDSGEEDVKPAAGSDGDEVDDDDGGVGAAVVTQESAHHDEQD